MARRASRLIWTSAKYARTNLSIGFNCVSSVNIRSVTSKLRGNSQALYARSSVMFDDVPRAIFDHVSWNSSRLRNPFMAFSDGKRSILGLRNGPFTPKCMCKGAKNTALFRISLRS